MRRHVRTVRRKRLTEILGERDGVFDALPGLACGVLALVLALFAVQVGRSRPKLPARSSDVARAGVAATGTATAGVSSVSKSTVPAAAAGGGR